MSGGDVIRIAVIGAGIRGAWGIDAIRRLSSSFRIVGITDAIPERARFLAHHFELGEACPTFAAMDECLRGADFDAVAVFTPDSTHADVVLPALETHKHVFVEKPLDVTHERVQQIVDADARAGGRTFVGLNLRFAPMYARILELIEQGVAGRVFTIQADDFYDGGRTYFRRWNRLRAAGGGLWVTKSCHDFDLLYWLSGGAKPVSVFASGSLGHYKPLPQAAMYCRDCSLRDGCADRYDLYVKPGSLSHQVNELTERVTGRRPDLCVYNSDKDTIDHGAAVVTFDNGVVATYTLNVVAGFTNRRLRVSGSKATIDGDLERSQITICHRDPTRIEEFTVGDPGQLHGGADEQIFPAFAEFVRGDRDPSRYVSPSEAAVAVRIGLAAQESMDRGKAISLSLAGRGQG
jgi:predicted dehydrogenase